ncbi:MAG: ABC transporter substrate-binding protein [Candidatus Riflebacteria bacterium]|nr:ABC transporter substrate-binding protein [Candidatus Riflebacteria bacterium]
MKNNTFFLPVIALLLTILGLFFIWGNKKPRFIVGVIGPLTGPASPYGKAQKNGVLLAASIINKSNSAAGRTIEVIPIDDKNDKIVAAEAARDLIYKKGAFVIIGAISSDNTMNIQRVCEMAKIPMITAVSTNPFITRVNFSYTFRCLADDNTQAAELAGLTSGKMNLRRMAIIHDDNKYGSEGARTYKKVAEKLGQQIVAMEPYSGGASNFRDQIEKIRKFAPDGLVIWGLFRESALILRHAREANLNVPVFGGDGMALPAFLDLAGPAAENTVLTYPFDPSRGGLEATKFIESYRKAYQEDPDSFAAHGYDAMRLVGMALANSDGTSEKLRDALIRIKSYDGTIGKGGFDETGNETRPVQLARVKNGAFNPLPIGEIQ